MIDRSSNIYVGFDPDFGAYGFCSEFGAIIHLDPRGRSSIAASGLHFPNGMVVTEDGARFVVTETGTPRLTAFTIGPAGALADRSVWGLVDAPSDPAVRWGETGLGGCALDAEGCISVANSGESDCIRLRPGGEIVDIVRLPRTYRCLACALGGENGRTLLICGFELALDNDLAHSKSHLFIAEVAIGAAR